MTTQSWLRMQPRKVYNEIVKAHQGVILRKCNNYCMIKGSLPIVLTAHVDTVFSPQIMRDKHVGADDRAGCYAIWQILRKLGNEPKPHIILCNHEELGCQGSNALVDDYPGPPFDLNWIIGLDRRGKDDAVFYDCDNSAFTKFILSYGFRNRWGSYSDIAVMSPAWDVASVNLSIGFDHEHTLAETWNVNYTWMTINRVLALIHSKEVNTSFAWEGYTPHYPYRTNKYQSWNNWDDDYPWRDWMEQTKHKNLYLKDHVLYAEDDSYAKY